MHAETIIYLGASLPFLWGIAHLFPTRSVIKGFGDISMDNKNIIAMEWIIEGIALIFIGAMVAAATTIAPKSEVSTAVYLMASFCLMVLAVISLFTGFRINFLPFRLCAAIFTSSAILITAGWLLL